MPAGEDDPQTARLAESPARMLAVTRDYYSPSSASAVPFTAAHSRQRSQFQFILSPLENREVFYILYYSRQFIWKFGLLMSYFKSHFNCISKKACHISMFVTLAAVGRQL